MRCVWIWCMIAAVLAMPVAVAAKKVVRDPVRFEARSSSRVTLPPDLSVAYPMRSAAAADTFVLHEASFDGPGGLLDPMGYTSVDRSSQIATFFHVADGTELDGGENGSMFPLSGARSMWCGQAPSSTVPFCGYATLPGYGNNWNQILVCDPQPGDSMGLSYRVFWDSEPAYDFTEVEYSFDGGSTWSRLVVGDTVGFLPGVYDDSSPAPFVDESFHVGSPGASDVIVRFQFHSDIVYSDEDGLWSTDGAIILDDLAVDTWSGGVPATSDFEDFESTVAVPGHGKGPLWCLMAAIAIGFDTSTPLDSLSTPMPSRFRLPSLRSIFVVSTAASSVPFRVTVTRR